MSNADIRGRFVWHELMTTDTKAAGAFYPKVTAWKTQAWDKDPSYTLWVSAKGPFGGVRTLPDAGRAAGAAGRCPAPPPVRARALKPAAPFIPDVAFRTGRTSSTFLPTSVGLAHSSQPVVRSRFPIV